MDVGLGDLPLLYVMETPAGATSAPHTDELQPVSSVEVHAEVVTSLAPQTEHGVHVAPSPKKSAMPSPSFRHSHECKPSPVRAHDASLEQSFSAASHGLSVAHAGKAGLHVPACVHSCWLSPAICGTQQVGFSCQLAQRMRCKETLPHRSARSLRGTKLSVQHHRRLYRH